MHRKIKILAALTLALLAASCGPTLTPFTQELYQELDWTKDELSRIQFYVSEDIVLQRDFSGSTSEIIAGEIKVIDGREVEQVVIPRGTPGIFLFSPKNNRLAIGFEEGKNDRYLMFGPSPRANDRYVLLASRWSRRNGMVTYEEKKYRVNSRSAYATLMVDLKKVRKVSTSSRTAKGRRVGF